MLNRFCRLIFDEKLRSYKKKIILAEVPRLWLVRYLYVEVCINVCKILSLLLCAAWKSKISAIVELIPCLLLFHALSGPVLMQTTLLNSFWVRLWHFCGGGLSDTPHTVIHALTASSGKAHIYGAPWQAPCYALSNWLPSAARHCYSLGTLYVRALAS